MNFLKLKIEEKREIIINLDNLNYIMDFPKNLETILYFTTDEIKINHKSEESRNDFFKDLKKVIFEKNLKI